MERRVRGVALVVAALATACGARVSDQQVARELREDALRAGLSGGTGPAVAGGGNGGVTASGENLPGVTTGGGSVGAPAGGGGTVRGLTGGGPTRATGPQGCAAARGSTDVGVTATEIRVGNVSTLTGPVPGLFRGALVGTQAFFNYLNSAGGLCGRQVQVLSGDDALDSGKNRAVHLELKDKVFAFVGSFSVSDDGGASVLRDCNCPDIGGALSKARFILPNQFSPQPQPPGWRSGPPTWYAQQFPKEVLEHWALFVSGIESARDIARDQRAVYESKGFRVVYTREVAPNETSFTADVVQMQRAGVRALSWQGAIADMARLADEMRRQNFKVDLPNWGNAMYDNSIWQRITPDTLEGTLIDQVYAMFLGEDAGRIPEVALFNQWMKRTDPSQPVDLFALYGWLSGRLFADAMQKVSSPTRANLLAALKTITRWDGNGMVGPVNPAEKKASDCFFVFKVTGGKFVRVFPADQRNFACDVAPYVYR